MARARFIEVTVLPSPDLGLVIRILLCGQEPASIASAILRYRLAASPLGSEMKTKPSLAEVLTPDGAARTDGAYVDRRPDSVRGASAVASAETCGALSWYGFMTDPGNATEEDGGRREFAAQHAFASD
jgi:hypothetical protein